LSYTDKSWKYSIKAGTTTGQMENLRETERKYASLAVSLAVVIGVACFLLAFKAIGKGLILGSLFSAGNFVLMGETLPMRIGHTRKKASGISFLLILARYFLMAIPLALSIKLAQFDLAATVCGLFMVQATIMGDHIFALLKTRIRKNRVF